MTIYGDEIGLAILAMLLAVLAAAGPRIACTDLRPRLHACPG